MPIATQAALEVARFLASRPSPEQILNFHPSAEVAERAYELIDTERAGGLSDEERAELESNLAIEHLMDLIKVEARRQQSPKSVG
jgi:hypothetical protein